MTQEQLMHIGYSLREDAEQQAIREDDNTCDYGYFEYSREDAEAYIEYRFHATFTFVPENWIGSWCEHGSYWELDGIKIEILTCVDGDGQPMDADTIKAIESYAA